MCKSRDANDLVTYQSLLSAFSSSGTAAKKVFYQEKVDNVTDSKKLFSTVKNPLNLHFCHQLPPSPLMTLHLSVLKKMLPLVPNSLIPLNRFDLVWIWSIIELILPLNDEQV